MNKIVNKLKDKLPQFCNTQDFWYVKFKDKQYYIDKKRFRKKLIYKTAIKKDYSQSHSPINQYLINRNIYLFFGYHIYL